MAPGLRARHYLCHPATMTRNETEAMGFLGMHEVLEDFIKELATEDQLDSKDWLNYATNQENRRLTRQHEQVRHKAAVKAMLIWLIRVNKEKLENVMKVWKREFVMWRRAYDNVEMKEVIEDKEQEILALQTEIIAREATIYLQSPTGRPMNPEFDAVEGRPQMMPTLRNKEEIGLEIMLKTTIMELANEVCREAYAEAFDLPMVTEELYKEQLGADRTPLEYTDTVGMKSLIEAELIDTCDLTHQMLDGILFQGLLGLLREPKRQDFVGFQEFAQEDWLGKLLAGAVLIDAGEKVEKDWARRVETAAIVDVGAESLVSALAEFGGYAPADAMVLMAETSANALSTDATRELLEAQEAMSAAMEADERIDIYEDEGDVDNYLMAIQDRDNALKVAQKEKSEAYAATAASKDAEIQVQLAKAHLAAEAETEEATQAREAAELAEERFAKALAVGDMSGICEAQEMAEESRRKANQEEWEAIEAVSNRKVTVVAAELAAIESLAAKQAAMVKQAQSAARLAESKLKAVLNVAEIDEITKAADVAEDARLTALRARADAATSNSKLQMAKVRLTAAQASAEAERERFEARVAAAEVEHAKAKLKIAEEIGSIDEIAYAREVARIAWDKETKELDEAEQATLLANTVEAAVQQGDADLKGGSRMFEEGIITYATEMFGKVDLDGSNTVDQHELETLLHKLLAQSGRKATQEEVQAQAEEALVTYDLDGSGMLDFGEFMALITRHPWSLCLPLKLQRNVKAAAETAASMVEASRASRMNKTDALLNREQDLRVSGTPNSDSQRSMMSSRASSAVMPLSALTLEMSPNQDRFRPVQEENEIPSKNITPGKMRPPRRGSMSKGRPPPSLKEARAKRIMRRVAGRMRHKEHSDALRVWIGNWISDTGKVSGNINLTV